MSFCEKSKKIYVGGRAVFKSCGKCRLCRTRFARDIAFRFQKDVNCWRNCYGYDSYTFFVTLTYDDEHIPVVDDPDSDKIYNYRKNKHYTACKKELMRYKERIRSQLFRDLKKRVPLIFVSSTEYGDSGHRPHCHFVVHGIPADYKEGDLSKMIDFFESKWKDKDGRLKGYVCVKVCDSGSVIYTVDYASSGTYEEGLPSVCESPSVQYSKGIGSRYFSRNADKLKKLGGVPCIIKKKGKKPKCVLLPYPRYFVRKYISTDKKFKRDHYKKSLKARAIDLTIKYSGFHPNGNYDEFVDASYKMYSMRRILDKLNRYCAADLYLSCCPFVRETWELCGTGKFNYDLISESSESKKRFFEDYIRVRESLKIEEREEFRSGDLLGLYDILLPMVVDGGERCKMYIRDVIWCIEHRRVCSSGRLLQLRDAYSVLYRRSEKKFMCKYFSYIDLFERDYRNRRDASKQKLYEAKSKVKGVL